MKVCGSYVFTCKGDGGEASQFSAPVFHCAGSDPGTGSEHADSAQYTIIVTDRSALAVHNRRNRFIFQFSFRATITISVKENAYGLDANHQSFGFISSILL